MENCSLSHKPVGEAFRLSQKHSGRVRMFGTATRPLRQNNHTLQSGKKGTARRPFPTKNIWMSARNDLCVVPIRQGAVGKKKGAQCRYFAQDIALSVTCGDSSPKGRAKEGIVVWCTVTRIWEMSSFPKK